MPKTVLFLSATRNSPSVEEQRAACAAPDDLIVDAGRLSLHELADRLARKGMGLEAGDTLKIYDLSCVAIATSTLIRIFVKALRAGVAVEICRPGLKLMPGDKPSDAIRMLEALDAHWRLIHGIKTKGAAKAKLGRKPRLQDGQLPAICEMLRKPGVTTAAAARELGVARTTLFDFLGRHGVSAKRP